MKPSATLFTATAACLLTACASFNGPLQAPPPANAATYCPPLSATPSEMDMGDLLTFTVGVVSQYHECAARHAKLVDYVKP